MIYYLIRVMIAGALLLPAAGDTVTLQYESQYPPLMFPRNAHIISKDNHTILLQIDGNCPSLTLVSGTEYYLTTESWWIHCANLPLVIKGEE
jgi:hypothetical protein